MTQWPLFLVCSEETRLKKPFLCVSFVLHSTPTLSRTSQASSTTVKPPNRFFFFGVRLLFIFSHDYYKAACRELKEETGYTACRVTKTTPPIFSDPGSIKIFFLIHVVEKIYSKESAIRTFDLFLSMWIWINQLRGKKKKKKNIF